MFAGKPLKLRDPLYGQIVVDEVGAALIDTPAFQRLRRIRQLSLVNMLHPSAMHTRFEHSLGVYHMARTIVGDLRERGELDEIPESERRLILWAALVHDTGHYVCAHTLEEFGYPGACHEEAGERWFTTGEMGDILDGTGIPDAGHRIAELVQGYSEHPLAGIVSGACDADKLDYLVRDADRCGLAPGFDQTHLRSSLTLVRSPRTGLLEVGLLEDGLVSFEQMLYAKNTLYRKAYFHPVVRAATVMQRAMIIAALESELLGMDELRTWSDEEVMVLLRVRLAQKRGASPLVEQLVGRLSSRRLYESALFLPLTAAPDLSAVNIQRAEDLLAAKLGLKSGEALLDVPRKPSMLSTAISVRLATDKIVSAEDLGAEHGFPLNRAKELFYAAAARIGLYVSDASVRDKLTRDDVLGVLEDVAR